MEQIAVNRLRKYRLVVILYGVFQNMRALAGNWRGGSVDLEGTRTRGLPVEESARYVRRVFDDYLLYAGLGRDDVAGRKVLELGPGDNLGVAVLFAAYGAQVVTLDKYRVLRDGESERALYRELLRELPSVCRDRAERCLSWSEDSCSFGEGIQEITGTGVEEDLSFLPTDFDLILSRAVLQYVKDYRAAVNNMTGLLKPGGMLLHKIDFRDDGLFTAAGGHALEQLTLSDPLYWMMSRWTFRPNRILSSEFYEHLEGLNFRTRVFPTDLLHGQSYKKPISWLEIPEEDRRMCLASLDKLRPRLARRFQGMAEESLCTLGAFIKAVKP